MLESIFLQIVAARAFTHEQQMGRHYTHLYEYDQAKRAVRLFNSGPKTALRVSCGVCNMPFVYIISKPQAMVTRLGVDFDCVGVSYRFAHTFGCKDGRGALQAAHHGLYHSQSKG